MWILVLNFGTKYRAISQPQCLHSGNSFDACCKGHENYIAHPDHESVHLTAMRHSDQVLTYTPFLEFGRVFLRWNLLKLHRRILQSAANMLSLLRTSLTDIDLPPEYTSTHWLVVMQSIIPTAYSILNFAHHTWLNFSLFTSSFTALFIIWLDIHLCEVMNFADK